MAEINVVIPGAEEPGYLRRMVKLAKIQDAMHADKIERGPQNISGETLGMLLSFISDYINVDEGVDKMEVLLDLSQAEYTSILDALGSVDVPKGSDTASNGSSEEN